MLCSYSVILIGLFAMTTQQLSILRPEERLTPVEFKENVLDKNVDHILIDVRPKVQTDFSKIAHAVAIPLGDLQEGDGLAKIRQLLEQNKAIKGIYVNCQRGNASQKAVKFLKDNKVDVDNNIEIKDIIGGIEAWVAQVDPSIPLN